MRLPLVLLVALAVLLPGCMGGGGGNGDDGNDGGGEGDAALRHDAPWWNLGESWTIQLKLKDGTTRTTTLVNFANNTFNDPDHFWLGVTSRDEALRHVFFDDNPFLGRIHWILLAPHEKGMHSTMFKFPLRDGERWSSPILLGKEDLAVEARQDGQRIVVEGEAQEDGARFTYDYDPATRWFRTLRIVEEDGKPYLEATVTDHKESGARGTYYFLRGRDYLDSKGGTTGKEETFTVKEEGATSIAFRLDVETQGPSALEFIDPNGVVVHRETLALGGTSGKLIEIPKAPTPGAWKLRYVGSVSGDIRVRGIIEYKASI